MLHYDGRYVTADVTAAATAHYSCAGSVCTTTEARAAVGYWEHLATHPPLLAGGAGYSSSSLTIACVETRRAYYWLLMSLVIFCSPPVMRMGTGVRCFIGAGVLLAAG
eukprot:6133305-Pyramimonas_sp.AAC.1